MTIDQLTAAILGLSTNLACASDQDESAAIEAAIAQLCAARKTKRGW